MLSKLTNPEHPEEADKEMMDGVLAEAQLKQLTIGQALDRRRQRARAGLLDARRGAASQAAEVRHRGRHHVRTDCHRPVPDG